MRRRAVRKLLALLAGIGVVLAVAAADDLQLIPALTARVTDTTGTLDTQQQQALESELAALEQSKGSQVAVLMVATTQPEEIEQYSIRVVDAWKLGRKNVDDGVLLIIAKDDHHVRIEVGRGLEGAIPDAAAARIIREYITPKFRAGDFNGGIHDAIDALTKLIDGEPLPPPLTNDHKPHSDMVNSLITALFIGFWARAFFGGLSSTPRAGLVGAATGGLAWFLSGLLPLGLGMGMFGLVLGWLGGSGGGGFISRGGSGGWSGGGGFGGGGGGGGFSGGGGGFAGGGASGSW
jgi:uncharacterized protein